MGLVVIFLVAIFLCAYICGLFPSGPLLVRGRLRGRKLTEIGSGGTGATNVLRNAGWGLAVIVLGLDALKAVVAVLVVRGLAGVMVGGEIFSQIVVSGDDFVSLCLAVGVVGCLCGHCFPVWSRGFRGGKGVASAAGLLLMVMPSLLAVGFVVWLGMLWFFGYSSLSSLAACIFIIIGLGVWGEGFVAWGLGVCVLIVIFQHRGNILRLWRGEERRVYDRRGRRAGGAKNTKTTL